jgi:hypothetical protein
MSGCSDRRGARRAGLRAMLSRGWIPAVPAICTVAANTSAHRFGSDLTQTLFHPRYFRARVTKGISCNDSHSQAFLQRCCSALHQAAGRYRAFQGGHNHMVDKLHKLADGRFDEFCFCIISQYQFP